MKFKNKILASIFLLVAVSGVSCKKYLDINTNPLASTKVDPKLLFGYAVTAWDVSKNSGDEYMAVGFMSQALSTGGDFSQNWGASNLYNLSPNFLGNTWRTYFSTAGNNLQQAIAIAQAASPVNNNGAAQCKIVLAQLIYEATTLYGDVPYSQAWQPDKFPYPKYDAQKDVLESLLKLLDEASAQIDPTSTVKIADYDIYYAGDMAKWKRLANSIKFKILMAMVDKDPTKAAAIGTLLSTDGTMLASTAETWLTKYSGASNNENPKYRLFLGENPFTYGAKVTVDLMNATNDPRLPQYFDLPDGQTTYIGVPANVDADEKTAIISNYLYRKDAPSVIISYQELELLRAEAYARGLGVPVNMAKAEELFKQGVKDAMTFYQADATAVATYVSDPTKLPDLTKLSATEAIRQIHLQQWIDLMDRPLEAFVQWRRSGPDGSEVPTLTLPKDATPGPLIRRYTLSPDETSSNPNIPNPQPRYFDKVWFDL